MAFRTMDEVIEEATQRENPELFFRTGMAQRSWSDTTSRELVAEWLRRNEKWQADEALRVSQAVAERTVRATEVAAEAARTSARWAGWAAAIAVIAMGLGTIPFILK